MAQIKHLYDFDCFCRLLGATQLTSRRYIAQHNLKVIPQKKEGCVFSFNVYLKTDEYIKVLSNKRVWNTEETGIAQGGEEFLVTDKVTRFWLLPSQEILRVTVYDHNMIGNKPDPIVIAEDTEGNEYVFLANEKENGSFCAVKFPNSDKYIGQVPRDKKRDPRFWDSVIEELRFDS